MGIVNTALDLVGRVRYVFGANDIEGGKGDCSAFTQYVFKKHGYAIGRDTLSQVTQGTEVAKANLKPGDLVFFEGTYREGVSHVGIYIGGGEMVNLQSAGVRVDSIKNGYWADHYMTARRVADAKDTGAGKDEADVENMNSAGPGFMGLTNTADLKWWGDVLVIVLVIGCVLLSVFFLYKTFAAQIKPVIADTKQIAKAVADAAGGEN